VTRAVASYSRCPHCGSFELARSSHHSFWERLVGLVGIKPHRCLECDHRFLARRWEFSAGAWLGVGLLGAILIVSGLTLLHFQAARRGSLTAATAPVPPAVSPAAQPPRRVETYTPAQPETAPVYGRGEVEPQWVSPEMDAAAVEIARLREEVTRLKAEVDEKEKIIDQAEKTSAPAGPKTADLARILFLPGQVELDAPALAAVKKATAEALARPKAKVVVEGHADSTPLSPTSQRKYGDNLGLSLVRALAVARALAQAGVDPTRLVVSGYGSGAPLKAGEPASPDEQRLVRIGLLTPDE